MFLTRIELHNVSESNSRDTYELLHKKMETYGFKRKIEADDGNNYKLPDATYNYTATGDVAGIRNLAKKVVELTGYKSSIFVCEFTQAAWTGLDIVQEKATSFLGL